MRSTHACFIGILLTGVIALAGCGESPSGPQVDHPSPSSTPTVTVLRASSADRAKAVQVMQGVTDFYGVTALGSAKALAARSSMEERTRDGGYDALLTMTGTEKLNDAATSVIPLLAGKTMGDFEAFQDWQGRIIHLTSSLQQWASGDVSMESDAAASLDAARADIERIGK